MIIIWIADETVESDREIAASGTVEGSGTRGERYNTLLNREGEIVVLSAFLNVVERDLVFDVVEREISLEVV